MTDIRDFGELMREEEQKALDIEKPKIQAELDAWHALPQEEKDRQTAAMEAKYPDMPEDDEAKCPECGTGLGYSNSMEAEVCDDCSEEDDE